LSAGLILGVTAGSGSLTGFGFGSFEFSSSFKSESRANSTAFITLELLTGQ